MISKHRIKLDSKRHYVEYSTRVAWQNLQEKYASYQHEFVSYASADKRFGHTIPQQDFASRPELLRYCLSYFMHGLGQCDDERNGCGHDAAGSVSEFHWRSKLQILYAGNTVVHTSNYTQ